MPDNGHSIDGIPEVKEGFVIRVKDNETFLPYKYAQEDIVRYKGRHEQLLEEIKKTGGNTQLEKLVQENHHRYIIVEQEFWED